MNIKEDFRKFAMSQGISGSTLHAYNNQIENMTRSIIEERPQRFAEIDVFSRLIMDRIIFLGTDVNDHISNIINAQLLFLESAAPKKDITMYINSPGGSVYAGLAMYDTMQFIEPDVGTVCTGMAASMGAVLLAGGAAGKRSALKHSRIMIHQVSSGSQGTFSDMDINLKQTASLRDDLYNILADHTGKTYKEIEKDCDRDYWLRSSEAKEYGLIDKVITKK